MKVKDKNKLIVNEGGPSQFDLITQVIFLKP